MRCSVSRACMPARWVYIEHNAPLKQKAAACFSRGGFFYACFIGLFQLNSRRRDGFGPWQARRFDQGHSPLCIVESGDAQQRKASEIQRSIGFAFGAERLTKR